MAIEGSKLTPVSIGEEYGLQQEYGDPGNLLKIFFCKYCLMCMLKFNGSVSTIYTIRVNFPFLKFTKGT